MWLPNLTLTSHSHGLKFTLMEQPTLINHILINRTLGRFAPSDWKWDKQLTPHTLADGKRGQIGEPGHAFIAILADKA